MADDGVDGYVAAEDVQETVDHAAASAFHLSNGLDMSHDSITAEVIIITDVSGDARETM